MYQLQGFVVHTGGTIDSGHYISYVYHKGCGTWIKCNDDKVSWFTFKANDNIHLEMFWHLACIGMKRGHSVYNIYRHRVCVYISVQHKEHVD